MSGRKKKNYNKGPVDSFQDSKSGSGHCTPKQPKLEQGQDISANDESKQKGIMFKKGSENHGNLYEQQVMALLAITLIYDNAVDDFEMITNPNDLGDFDDILLKVKYKNHNAVMYVIQVKHSVKILKFTEKKETKSEKDYLKISVSNYSNSYKKIHDLVMSKKKPSNKLEEFLKDVNFDNYHFCIVTNMSKVEPELLKYNISSDSTLKLLDMAEHKTYGLLNKTNFSIGGKNYDDFCKRLAIFHDQPNCTDITSSLIGKIDKVTFTQPMANYLYNLIAENSVIMEADSGPFCNTFNKNTFIQFLIQIILCHRVSIYMVTTEPIDDKYMKIWDAICRKYQYILIDKNTKTNEVETRPRSHRRRCEEMESKPKKNQNLLQLIASYYEFRIREFTKGELEDMSSVEDSDALEIKQFNWNNCQQKCYQLDHYLRKALAKQNIKAMNLVDLLIELWKVDNLPIIAEESIAHVIKDLGSSTKRSFFVVSDDDTSSQDGTFSNLLDIRNGPASDKFDDIMDLQVSLQGRKEVPLKEVIGDHEETLKLISSSDLLRWIAQEPKERVIGLPLKQRVKYYRQRRFCVPNSKETITEASLVKNLEGYDLTIISNDAGMGKSTVLTSLALEYDPTRYTIIYDLANCKKDLQDKDSVIHTDPIRYFYAKMQTSESKLVEGILKQHQQDKKLVMFIDSFDEIMPIHEKIVLDMIKKILSKGIHVFLTSRTQAEDKLKFDNVKSRIVKLDYLDGDDIAKYFEECEIPEDAWQKLSQTFLSTPLHLKMFNNIYKTEKDNGIGEINQTKLYKKFIDRKIHIFYNKKNMDEHHTQYSLREVVDSILDAHNHIALVYLFGLERTDDLKIVTTPQWKETIKRFEDYKLSLGIVSSITPDIKFNHKTFSEYLAADYLKNNPEETKELYKDIVKDRNFHQIYTFLHELRSTCKGQDTIEAYIVEDNAEKVLEKLNSIDWNKNDNYWGLYPIHWAAVGCYLTSNSEKPNMTPFKVLEMILERTDDDDNSRGVDGHLGWTWLNFLTGYESVGYHHFKSLINTIKYTTGLKGKLRNTILSNINMNYRDKDGCTLSQLAARHGDLEIFNYVIGAAPIEDNYNHKDKIGRYLLHHASFGGSLEIFNMLLRFDRMFKTGIHDDNSQNFLHHACKGASSLEIVKILVDKLPREERNAKDIEHRSIFHLACAGCGNAAKDIVDFLVDNEVIDDIQAEDKDRWTALHHASRMGNEDIVKKLLLLDFDIQKTTSTGQTPLHLASKTDNGDLVQFLLDKKAEPNAVDHDGMTPLHHAALEGKDKVVDVLLKFSNNALSDAKGRKVLHHAALGGNFKVIEALIGEIQPIDERDNQKQTPLHNACCKGHQLSAKFLLDRGANPNLVDQHGRNALHLASIAGNTTIVETLLSDGRIHDVDVQDKMERTALHYAAEHGNVDVVVKLLYSMASPMKCDKDYSTPVHIACSKGSLEIVERLLIANADPEQQDKNGRNALFYAFQSGNVELCKFLIEKGIDPWYNNIHGHAPVERARDTEELKAYIAGLSPRQQT